MKEQVSALMDDALDDDEVPAVVDALATEPELSAAWNEYHLIGDSLRGAPVPAIDIAERVMAAIRGRESVLTAPNGVTPRKPPSL